MWINEGSSEKCTNVLIRMHAASEQRLPFLDIEHACAWINGDTLDCLVSFTQKNANFINYVGLHPSFYISVTLIKIIPISGLIQANTLPAKMSGNPLTIYTPVALISLPCCVFLSLIFSQLELSNW